MATDRRTLLPTAIALAVITALGGAVRVFGVVQADFPLNDGGLFYRMVLDLQATWPTLPVTTTYNDIGAPYAYPPLAFYVGALLEPLLGLDLLRVIPVVAAVLTIPAFYLLARAILASELTALVATGVFALMPRTFEWMTMGGGLTRAPGLLLSIVALWLTHRLLVGGGWGWALAAGIAGGLVSLTHPQAALFTVLSGLLLVAWHARDRATLTKLAAALGVAVLVALPWIVTMIARDQLGAITSAGGTQPGPIIGLLSFLSFQLTGSRLFDVVGLFAAIGLVLSILRGRWLLPAWIALVLVLDARGGATYASIPASMLAGQAFVDLFLRPFWRTDDRKQASERSRSLPRMAPPAALLASVLVAVAIIDAFGSQLAPTWPAVALSPDQRAAIELAGDTAPEGDVLVVSGRYWPVDATAEWFPVLAGAHSVNTVQGHEWLGTADFDRRADASEALRDCTLEGPACLDAWAEEWGSPYTHVFLPRGPLAGPFGDADCCTALRVMLEADSTYELVTDHPGGTLFEHLDG